MSRHHLPHRSDVLRARTERYFRIIYSSPVLREGQVTGAVIASAICRSASDRGGDARAGGDGETINRVGRLLAATGHAEGRPAVTAPHRTNRRPLGVFFYTSRTREGSPACCTRSPACRARLWSISRCRARQTFRPDVPRRRRDPHRRWKEDPRTAQTRRITGCRGPSPSPAISPCRHSRSAK